MLVSTRGIDWRRGLWKGSKTLETRISPKLVGETRKPALSSVSAIAGIRSAKVLIPCTKMTKCLLLIFPLLGLWLVSHSLAPLDTPNWNSIGWSSATAQLPDRVGSSAIELGDGVL